jgi:bifunctional UDP-N-acetylglucosamine pyrophosphorylase/glucosamine-1-phosphate N-acetyltransferase
VDTHVEDGATVTFAVALDSRIGPGAEVGPFASLRPGTRLRAGAKAGTFVEMKAADIGEDSKVPHLAYMGDVRVGKRSNIGAGTITCNYNPFELAPDGSTKHRTWIGDDVYVSSDTMLVAPVRLGDGSQTGAGSVVNRNVKAKELVFGVPAQPHGPAKERADGKRKASKGAKSSKAAKRSKSAGRTKKGKKGS